MKKLNLKSVFLILCLAFVANIVVFPQVKDSVIKQTTVQAQPVTVDPGQQIVLPTIPEKGSGLWTWILWILAVAVSIDTVIRFIPTSGKFSWITKLLKILHDASLYLDNTKKSIK